MSGGSEKRFGAAFVLFSLLMLLTVFVPAAFADSGGVAASPSSAPPNSVISLINTATVGQAIPFGYYDSILFVAVLTPSGTIWGSNNGLEDFLASGAGTYQCTIPFGGAAASLSASGTGGVTPIHACSGSDSSFWFGLGSAACPGVGNICTGSTGLADLASVCAPGSVGDFGYFPPGPSTGDTSQVGTYQVLTCWNFVSSTPSSGTVNNYVPSTTTFQILPSGVPQFPLGLAALFAVLVPAMVLLRARLGHNLPRLNR